MPTALQRQYASLERQRSGLLQHLGTYSEVQQAFLPSPESWSLAGVVQHLVLVEEVFVRTGRREAGMRPALVRLRSRLALRMVLGVLGRDVRIRAPVAAVVPSVHVPLAQLGPRWEAARSDLLAYLAELPGPTWARTAFFHPRTGWLTATSGLRFVAAHCDHHRRQIDRIVASAGFPSR